MLRTAVKKFGEVPQLVMTMEETAELTQALSKYLRGNDNKDNIAEEIADVSIMLQQLQIIFGNKSLVNKYIEQKINRLSEKYKIIRRATKPQQRNPPNGNN